MDPLSDVLSLLRPRSYGCGGIDTGGDVAISFPRHEGIKCYAVVSGGGWLAVEGIPDAVRLSTGDCFVLPRGMPFRLASDLDLTPVDYRSVLAGRSPGTILTLNGGGGCMIVGGHFALDGKHADLLLRDLPPIVHIRSKSDKTALRASLDRMMQELRDPNPGGRLIVEHLAQMMLVQALRLHIAEGRNGRVGWLFALSDKQIGPAISAMHSEPGRRWTLLSLAGLVGMSRTTFAQKFKATVGTSPLNYLIRWRMLVAGDRLTNSGDPISTLAPSLGYDSESAFSTAFKRVMGCSPRQYGKVRITALPEFDEGTAESSRLEAITG